MTDSWGTLQKRETAQVEELMVNHLGIKPADFQRMRDARVVSLVKQMAGLNSSRNSFHELMKCLPPEVRNSELEDVNGMVFSGETVGSYSEKLWLQTEHFATVYVLAFNQVVNLHKLSTLKI